MAGGPAVRLLGPIEVVGPAGPALLVGARQRGLVALLALNAGSVVAQSRLVDALWGEDPPRTAVRSLHSHVSRVRRALLDCGLGDVLRTREPGYLLALERDRVDVHAFEDAVRAGDPRSGLALWRGDPLADGEPAGWAAAEAERLRQARLAAVEDLWEAELRAGRCAAAVGELERELVDRPGRERLVGLLMLALCRDGRHADALDRYERLRVRLADELGADPGPRLRALHTAILRRDPSLDPPPDPPDPPGPGGPGFATGASGPRAAGPGTAAAGPTGPAAGGSGAGGFGGAGPGQLPPPVGHFTGRGGELDGLDDLADDERVVVVSGPAGVGKTAFAVQWAHRVRSRFPDGQLFLDLRGHDPDAALTPGQVLTSALRGLGVPAARTPTDLAEQTGLYRSLTADRRLLVLLDDGGTADHVLPLVPGTPGSLLVVTSRHRLAALSVSHGVRSVRLDVLAAAEARSLLGRVLGAERVGREPAEAAALAELCGRMPLALRIAAARLVARPHADLAELVAELSGDDRLGALAVDGDVRGGVRAVFAGAYSALSEPAARLFRLLGLHPGPEFGSHLAAAVTGLSHGRARRSVDELAAAHLVTEVAAGRYRFHDLVRLFARERAEAEETPAGREAAAGRVLDWYLEVAGAANATLDPARDRVAVRPPAEPPFARTHAAVLAFLDGEHPNLAPVVEHAARHGHHDVAWRMAYLLAGYFESRGHRADRLAVGRWGLGAARQVGDPVAEGLMLSGLGVSCLSARRPAEALEHFAAALPVMRATGDRRGEGHVHNNRAAAYAQLGRHAEAAAAFEAALAAHTASGHRHGRTLTLNNLGHLYGQLGRTADSLRCLGEGLALAAEDGDPRLEAAVLHSLGQTLRGAGDAAGALDRFGRALELRRRIGDRTGELRTRTELGHTRLATGDPAAAGDLGAALELARRLGDPHAEAAALADLGRASLAAGDPAAAARQLDAAAALRARVPDAAAEAALARARAELRAVTRSSGSPGSTAAAGSTPAAAGTSGRR